VFGKKYIVLNGGHVAVKSDNAMLPHYKGLTSGHSIWSVSNI